MINGQITIQGCQCAVVDGEANKIVDGKPTDEKVPLKILAFKDANSGLQVNVVFTPEQLQEFLEKASGNRIVRAPKLIPLPKFFSRNGGIRG